MRPGVFTPTDFALHGIGSARSNVGFVLDTGLLFHLAQAFDLGAYFKYGYTSTEHGGMAIHVISTGLRMRFPIQIANRFQIRFGGGFGVCGARSWQVATSWSS